MGRLARVLSRIDDRLSAVLDRHLEMVIPTPRASSEVPVRHLTPAGQQFQVLDIYSHCRCCHAYSPQPCPVIHRTPCDRSECGQPEDVA